jgi:hypothetical protein
MQIEVKRRQSMGRSTIGEMFVDGAWQCYTLEDVVREKPGVPVMNWKVKGETAIPAGTYKVVINMSTRFKKLMPLLLNVPGFSGVRIHPGNTHENTEGCILVGRKLSLDTITESRLAYLDLFAQMVEAEKGGEDIYITISNPDADLVRA